MIKLILKDFSVQKKTIVRYIISGFIISILFFLLTDMKQITITMGIIMFPIIYGFLNGALHEDEKNNTLRLLVSLPVDREMIVHARYVSVLLITSTLSLLMWVISFLIPENLVLGGKEVSVGISGLILAMALAFMLMVSIYLPLAFKLGYIKAAGINRFVMIALFGAIGGLGASVGMVSKNGKPPEWFGRFGDFISKVHSEVILGYAILVVALIYLMSMRLSVKFFKARNLF